MAEIITVGKIFSIQSFIKTFFLKQSNLCNKYYEVAFGGLAYRAGDSERQIFCRAKAALITHARMATIEKSGPQELLEHHF